ncbi:MAG: hypothetical protein ACPGXK_05565 [Phycisphaerae bacterium]
MTKMTSFKRITLVLSLATAWSFAIPVHGAVVGQEIPDTPEAKTPAVKYQLDAESSYSDGCMGNTQPACLCPIFLATEIVGSLNLKEATGSEPGNRMFNVVNVSWLIFFGSESVSFDGDGTYTVTETEDGLVQRLTIDGILDDGLTELELSLDSLEIPGGQDSETPSLDIPITLNNLEGCFDILIDVVASPDIAPRANATVTEIGARRSTNSSNRR